MRVVDKTPRTPKHCAVSGRSEGRFIDFMVDLDLPKHEPYHLYLLDHTVEEAARELGMVKAKEVEELKERLEALEKELADTKDTMELAAELESKLGAGRERIAA